MKIKLLVAISFFIPAMVMAFEEANSALVKEKKAAVAIPPKAPTTPTTTAPTTATTKVPATAIPPKAPKQQ